MVPFFPINLPKIEPQAQSLFREECDHYEAALHRHRAERLSWWRRLGLWLRPEEDAKKKSGPK